MNNQSMSCIYDELYECCDFFQNITLVVGINSTIGVIDLKGMNTWYQGLTIDRNVFLWYLYC